MNRIEKLIEELCQEHSELPRVSTPFCFQLPRVSTPFCFQLPRVLTRGHEIDPPPHPIPGLKAGAIDMASGLKMHFNPDFKPLRSERGGAATLPVVITRNRLKETLS